MEGGVWSVKCGVESVECGVWRVECGEGGEWRVVSVECGEGGVGVGEFGAWSAEWRVESVECGAESVECEVWSVEWYLVQALQNKAVLRSNVRTLCSTK